MNAADEFNVSRVVTAEFVAFDMYASSRVSRVFKASINNMKWLPVSRQGQLQLDRCKEKCLVPTSLAK